MSNAELENLIDAYVCGELDESGRARLLALVESNPAAARAFDDALHLEALLSVVHADSGAQRRATEKLKARLNKSRPAPMRRKSPVRLAPVVRPPRNVTPLLRPRTPSPIGAWTALAAAVAVMFGLAFYFIYKENPATEPNKSIAEKSKDEKTTDKKPPEKVEKNDAIDKTEKNEKVAVVKTDAYFSVASGKIAVDGNVKTDIGENEWLSVSGDGPATVRAKNGASVTLDAGSRAILRSAGATLQSGAARFKLQPGLDPFVVQTPMGTVTASGGEFEARFEPGVVGHPQCLSVTVKTGSAQVVELSGKSERLAEGESRTYCKKPANGDHPKPLDPAKLNAPIEIRLRPPEQIAADAMLEHAAELGLTADQTAKIRAFQQKIAASTAKVVQDARVKELFEKMKLAEAAHDEESIHEARRQMRDRADEMLAGEPDLGDPLGSINQTQRDALTKILEADPPEGWHQPDGPRPPHPPPPPPPGGKGGKDGRPPRPE